MPRRTAHSAFTLVELMLVLLILGVLISITIPALGSTRATAQRVKCLANLRSFGQAFANYTIDSKGLLPRVRPLHEPNAPPNDQSLLDVLTTYLSIDTPRREVEGDPTTLFTGVADVLICPSDKVGTDPQYQFAPLWRTSGCSYEYLAGGMMVGIEQIFNVPSVLDAPERAQKAVTNVYGLPQWRDLPVMNDHEDWHPLRKGKSARNGVFLPDWRADWTGPIVTFDIERDRLTSLYCDLIRAGGFPWPGCN